MTPSSFPGGNGCTRRRCSPFKCVATCVTFSMSPSCGDAMHLGVSLPTYWGSGRSLPKWLQRAADTLNRVVSSPVIRARPSGSSLVWSPLPAIAQHGMWTTLPSLVRGLLAGLPRFPRLADCGGRYCLQWRQSHFVDESFNLEAAVFVQYSSWRLPGQVVRLNQRNSLLSFRPFVGTFTLNLAAMWAAMFFK